jgi:2-polyprenyl-3-methyl-5-hydroxy-6-metoxy-1,4-benzoquinol methylase
MAVKRKDLGPINTTECGMVIERIALPRGQIHRDYIAHCLRWSYVLKQVKIGMQIIDVGCGSFPLLKALYSNKLKPRLYVGLDIRRSVIEKMMKFKTNFTVIGHETDIRVESLPIPEEVVFTAERPFGAFTTQTEGYDIAVCLEVVEHFEDKYVDHVLSEIRRVLKVGGLLLLSTPNFNGSAAKNHIHEYTADELGKHIWKYFTVEKMIGTFASQRDIEPVLSPAEREVYENLKSWFKPEIISVVFASMHPLQSRNILWVCRKEDKIRRDNAVDMQQI